eukprot:TRINITY_DN67004_c0_g1_i1.p1 TRINITY_DN67004_c0_g1~~TRINITY_DN67004_c0_g1_i1.p1  ORF type:complete len:386 (+),score=138.48 TRINITY_DN67004_c0_g1_i1:54-1211(+)
MLGRHGHGHHGVDEHRPISSVLGLVVLWYTCSVVGNITSKMILTRFPHPCTVMMGPIVTGVLTVPCVSMFCKPRLAALLLTGDKTDTTHSYRWTWRALLRSAWTRKRLCLLLGILSLGAGLFHRIALLSVHVSFAHTIKAISPLYSCFFSYLFFNSLPANVSLLSLLLVVTGIVLSAYEESSGEGKSGPGSSSYTRGIVSLQLSVAAGTLGSVVQKYVFSSLDKAEVFCLTTGTATLLNLGLWAVSDFPVLAGMLLEGRPLFEGSAVSLLGLFVANSATLALQHFTSLSALHHLSPTSHSLVACMKRVLVIAASAIFFGNPMTSMNAFGAAVAIMGVTGYEWGKKVAKEAAANDPDAAKKRPRTTGCALQLMSRVLPTARETMHL